MSTCGKKKSCKKILLSAKLCPIKVEEKLDKKNSFVQNIGILEHQLDPGLRCTTANLTRILQHLEDFPISLPPFEEPPILGTPSYIQPETTLQRLDLARPHWGGWIPDRLTPTRARPTRDRTSPDRAYLPRVLWNVTKCKFKIVEEMLQSASSE